MKPEDLAKGMEQEFGNFMSASAASWIKAAKGVLDKTEITPLLVHEEVTLASGRTSEFKIECDALTPEDIDAAAWLMAKLAQERVYSWHKVVGVPRGGVPLAEAIDRLFVTNPKSRRLLVVDDVWTTGYSMGKFIDSLDLPNNTIVVPVVLFARGGMLHPKMNPMAVFQLNFRLWGL